MIPPGVCASAPAFASWGARSGLGAWILLWILGLVLAVAALCIAVGLRRRMRADLHLRLGPARGVRPALAAAMLLLLGALALPLLRQEDVQRHAAELRRLAASVRLLDERLTASARLAAATGELRWAERHEQATVELDQTLRRIDALLEFALGKQAEAARRAMQQTSACNDALLALEQACFARVRAGDRAGAATAVLSAEYEDLKARYDAGAARAEAAVGQHIDRAVRRDELLAFSAGALGILAAAITILGMALLARAMAHHARALAASEARLRTLTNTMPGVAYRCRWDARRSVLFVSKGAREIAGSAADALLADPARGLASLMHPDDCAAVLAEIDRAVAERRSYVLEYRVLCDGGEARHVWERGVPVFEQPGDAAPAWLDGVFVDATERWRDRQELARARDAAESASRAKAEFLANMSHEIRTPMNAVIGMTGLLLETGLNSDQRETVEMVQSSADALLVLINDILDFSKIEAGRLELETLDFDVADVLEDIAGMLRHRADGKDVELTVDVAPDLPGRLSGDAGRVRQVLINLAGNALKFTERGEVSIAVRRVEQREDAVVVRFEVRDTGIGIPGDRLDQLFQPFTQVDSSTSRRFGGTGLGLAICRQLVELMQGRIGCDSQEGRGSRFWFTLPLGRPQGPAEARVEPGALSGKHVLVVDDNATSRRNLQAQLTARGAQVHVAAGAAAALELLEHPGREGGPFDAAVLDLRMPDCDGVQLAQELGRRGAVFPRVLLTSKVLSGHAERFREAGLSAWLCKPARPERLVEALRAAMAAGPAPQPALDQEPVAASGPALPPARILVADDNHVNQRVAQKMLARLGCEAEVVANGREVLEALRRAHYDVILMDCQMPEMDGFEATRAIRAADSGCAAVRVVAVTANAMTSDRERCFAAGMDDYLAKPFKLHELHEALLRNLVVQDPAGSRDG